jgi:hypothetical protein
MEAGRPVRIALAQGEPVTRDVVANLAMFDDAMERAAESAGEIVQAAHNTPDPVCGEVDYAITHRMRPMFPILRDLRAEMYAQLEAVMNEEID